VVADRSRRAARRAAPAAAGAVPVVLDADGPGLAAGAFDAIVCANLIDLLDRPLALPAALAAALRPGGTLVLASPDPELGGEDAGPLDDALARAGFAIDAVHDAVPWAHVHPPRHAQAYLVRVVVARRREPGLRDRKSSRSRAGRA
jgi:SAM-dependent methyltransferase